MSRKPYVWAIPYVVVVAGFLATVATYYRPGLGFTAFLTLPAHRHDTAELPAARGTAHFHDPSYGYDGQFYAQMALDPLLRDPAIDRALDSPPYRARRILFSWTAYLIGFGQPARVLAVFALQNVVAWLVFAALLLRWFPVGTPRSFLLWTACLLAHGMLASVRHALLDGPSVVLLALAVIAAEAAHPWRAALAVGVAGLARETNVLAASLLVGFLRRSLRSWLLVGGCLVVVAVPLLLWIDYLRSIYMGSSFPVDSHLTVPLSGLAWKLGEMWRSATWNADTLWNACAIVAFLTQAITVWWFAARRAESSPWLSVALSFSVLGVLTDQPVWAGSPGAITRVVLPLTIGFNIVARAAPWPVLALGNLTVVPGVLWFVSGL